MPGISFVFIDETINKKEVFCYENGVVEFVKYNTENRNRLHDIIQKNGKIVRIPFRGQTPPGVLFAVYDSVSKQAEYIPPEYIDIEPLINELVDWYYNNQDLPAPILSAIIHYALVTIHPFKDGNGRTSRALATYVLMQHDYDFKGFNSFEKANNLIFMFIFPEIIK